MKGGDFRRNFGQELSQKLQRSSSQLVAVQAQLAAAQAGLTML